jgi:hypothetical protein
LIAWPISSAMHQAQQGLYAGQPWHHQEPIHHRAHGLLGVPEEP